MRPISILSQESEASERLDGSELRRELRITKDELARALEEQRVLQHAAEAARLVSVAEAQARVDIEEALERAHDRIAELEALAHASFALMHDKGSLALASIRMFRRFKDNLLPSSTPRRSAYDRGLAALKQKFGLAPS